MTLEEKQAEALARNTAKRARQNRKNASGPRKKQETTRSRRSVLPAMRDMIASDKIATRWRVLLIYWLAILEGKEPLPLPANVWNVKDDEPEVENLPFQIREILPGTLSSSGQTSRETVSVGE